MPQHRPMAAMLATAALCAAVVFHAYGRGFAARNLPEQLSDREFWTMVESFSEPNGYFRSDNLLSNENAFQRVIPTLQATLPSGGVYLGVGPEQNFTYLAALRPRHAPPQQRMKVERQQRCLVRPIFEELATRARPPGGVLQQRLVIAAEAREQG